MVPRVRLMVSKPVSGPCDEMLEVPDHFRFAVLNRPISLNRNPTGCSKERIFSSSWSFLQEEDFASGPDLGGSTPERSPCEVTILFIPVSAPQNKLETDWAEDCDKIILRQCPRL
jgi:hypothetical protein